VPFGYCSWNQLDMSPFMVTIGSLEVWPRLDHRITYSWSTSSSPGNVHQEQIWGTDWYVLFPYSVYSKDQVKDFYFFRSTSRSQFVYVLAARSCLSKFSLEGQLGPFAAFFWVLTLIIQLYSQFALPRSLFLLVLCSYISCSALRPPHNA